MCVLLIKVAIRKKSGNLFNDPCICFINDIEQSLFINIENYTYIYIYI